METLQISDEGTFTLAQGDVISLVNYLREHGVPCDPTGLTSGGDQSGPVLQGRVYKPFDPEQIQRLYQGWLAGK
jgi:hypothetical protein